MPTDPPQASRPAVALRAPAVPRQVAGAGAGAGAGAEVPSMAGAALPPMAGAAGRRRVVAVLLMAPGVPPPGAMMVPAEWALPLQLPHPSEV
ncbi:MAG: hypothetical protein V3T28_08920, partial [Gemmatimonadales bacterium]